MHHCSVMSGAVESLSGVKQRSVTQVYNMSSKPESVRQTPRFHRPHPSIFSITRSHRQLIKAVKIWKMPFLSSSNFTAGALKPRSFKERLRCVEIHRKASEDSTAPKSIACSIRDLQLCSSDSSPSPFNSPLESQDTRRRCPPVHSRHYRKQLQWYHTLSRTKRPHQLNLEGQRSQTALSVTDIGSSCQRKRCQRSSPSAESPPEFQTPARKTSRRLWRRQLDSSSSESSRSTHTTPADVKNTRQTPNNTHKHINNTNSLKSKTSWTEFNFLDIHSDSTTEASPAHRTQKNLSVTSKKDKRKHSPAATEPNVQTSDVTGEKIKSLQKTQNRRNEKMTFHRQQKVKKTKTREDREGTTSESSSGPHTTLPSENRKKTQRNKNKQTTDLKISDIEINKQVHIKTPSSRTKLRTFQHLHEHQTLSDRSFHLDNTEKHTCDE